jgi:AcrR family transcriptional regulator
VSSKSSSRVKRSRLNPADRRAHLIRTAIAVFAKEGIAASPVLRITQAAGVSNATFYHYFDNREELLGAVVATVVAEMTRELTAIQENLGYSERIAVGAMWVVTHSAANPKHGAILAELLARDDPALSGNSANLVSDIAAGARSGEFTTVATPLLVKTFAAMFAVGIREALDGRDAHEVGEFIATAQLRTLGVANRRAVRHAGHARTLLQCDNTCVKTRSL